MIAAGRFFTTIDPEATIMKAKLTRPAPVKNPKTGQFPKDAKGHFINSPAGTVIEHRDAYKLVQMGLGIPDDDECRRKCGMSDEQIADAVKAYERTDRGIHPEDFDLYEGGIINGYDRDGNPSLDGKRVPDEVIDKFRGVEEEPAPLSDE